MKQIDLTTPLQREAGITSFLLELENIDGEIQAWIIDARGHHKHVGQLVNQCISGTIPPEARERLIARTILFADDAATDALGYKAQGMRWWTRRRTA